MMTHQPVLLEEAINGLAIQPEGTYIDGTFGRGGHSQAILARLNAAGRLIVFDKDPAAIIVAERMAEMDARLHVHHGSFVEMEAVISAMGCLGQVSGILLDLGVSSPQLDEARRGFSFSQNGPLDMRMNTSQGETAADWLRTVGEKTLADVLFQYGEERYSRRIAKAIIKARETTLIETTGQLAEIIKAAHPHWPPHQHPATKSFQAIRIFINQELSDIESVLPQTLKILKKQGRLAIISFHSLEDRLVKTFVKALEYDPRFPRDMPIQNTKYQIPLKAIGKMIKPSTLELEKNQRSRSACLRIMERQ